MKEKILKTVKRILSVVIGLSLLVAAAIPSIKVSRYYSDGSISRTQARFKWFYEQEENSMDVVYLGSSSVYRYDINVQNYEEYGFTSAGLCTAAQPFVATKYLMEEALKTQNPKLFVIDIRQLVRTAASVQADEKIYVDKKLETYYASLFMSMNHSSTRWKMIDAVIDDAVIDPEVNDGSKHIAAEDAGDEAISWQLEFLRYHNTWKDFDSFKELYKALTDTDRYEEVARINGISMAASNKSYSKFACDYEETTDSLALPENYQEILDDLLQYIKENDLKVLFISTPYQACKTSHRRVQNYIGEYLEREGFEYIDFHDHIKEIGIDTTTDFYDGHHTNLYGSEKWTRYMGGILSERIGECKHSEEVEAQWDAAVKEWAVEREEIALKLDKNIAENKEG